MMKTQRVCIRHQTVGGFKGEPCEQMYRKKRESIQRHLLKSGETYLHHSQSQHRASITLLFQRAVSHSNSSSPARRGAISH